MSKRLHEYPACCRGAITEYIDGTAGAQVFLWAVCFVLGWLGHAYWVQR